MMGEQADLKRLAGLTLDQIQNNILAAISGNWKNLYPDKHGTGKKTGFADKRQQQTDSLIEGFAKRALDGDDGR